jgi:hypothetical protein
MTVEWDDPVEMIPTPATTDSAPTIEPGGAPATCPQCDGGVVQVQGLLACHDCDWTVGGR